MYIHNLDPVIFNLGFLSLRWYSVAYILGIIIGWWYGKKILSQICLNNNINFKISLFDDYISYVIISIILGGRIGYILFYNLEFYLLNPLEVFFIWKGGMSFHGGLLGIIIATIFFSKKNNLDKLIIFDVVSCVAPIGIFLGRMANFINSELFGKPTDLPWAIIFPLVDGQPRHPSQIYEAFLEGILLFLILNIFIRTSIYIKGKVASLFLILYSIFRLISELYREPDHQVGYVLDFLSMGSILSFFMIALGLIMYIKVR
jgi:phosphatidylglycerol:prolipoprotein diacylglycerol transferase|tara:strand:- start:6410 stop:7189 length:780 start_codon:yes stop_codon:yes gene_type:complete